MTKTIADLMTRNVLSIDLDNSMLDLHQMMKDHNVRHIPVLENGCFYGMVTQKSVLAKTMYLLDKYGVNALQRREKQVPVSELVDKDVVFANQTMPLTDAARFFLNNRHGCLPIVDDENQLLGIVTSSDFVRLSLTLLEG
ncbi:CBS domain-containing protein [Pseudoalteromonas piratica]|uniref:CBS domain containing protein n=1 Tax=Pseudoalteromonas piratica TaxID=1348114 RepID=A0A0A7EIY0_9GAMM|nr:CBS domain-containing protein [Pseudoalteromonas piratica]AIY65952.1 CBS domain containing protein [Pseudoalteromonas piratica]